MDFLERLKDKLESHSSLPSVIEIGTYNENKNTITIVPLPADITERYMNKDKIYPFDIQVLVHNKSNMAAYSMAQKIFRLIDNVGEDFVTSNNNSFKQISITNRQVPNFVARTDFGVLYTAFYRAELYIKGDG